MTELFILLCIKLYKIFFSHGTLNLKSSFYSNEFVQFCIDPVVPLVEGDVLRTCFMVPVVGLDLNGL